MKKEKKLKMSNKVFRIIMSSIMAILLIFSVVLTTVTNYFTPSLDTFLGKEKRQQLYQKELLIGTQIIMILKARIQKKR